MGLIRILKLISHADFFTVGNGIFGLLAIYAFIAYRPSITLGFIFIFLGMIFDGLDGVISRKFGSTHDFGRYLDSLSDSISFGLAPAVMVVTRYYDQSSSALRPYLNGAVIVTALLVVGLSWYRLYDYTISAYKLREFYGLAAPGMTFFLLLMFHILTPDSDYRILLAMILAAMAAFAMVWKKVRYPKLNGKLGYGVSGATVFFIVLAETLKYLGYTASSGAETAYWVIMYLSLGIFLGYVFISPIYVMFGLDDDYE